MRKPRCWLLTFLWTFPADAVAWVAILFVRLLFGSRLSWIDGLWVELRKGSFPDRTWGKSWLGVTLAHGGVLAAGRAGGPGADTDTERHELVHVEQFESRMLCGFVLGLLCAVSFLVDGCSEAAIACALFVWLLSWPLGYVAAMVQAYLRGEDPYSGNELEESAYAQTEDDEDDGYSKR
ncbi:MAG: hypothetical protein ABFD77_01190 [Thermotogota bacterium]